MHRNTAIFDMIVCDTSGTILLSPLLIVCSTTICDKNVHHRQEFLHYYNFESVHDGDRDGVVRIFLGLSYEL